jgi:hypothetical protein
MKYLAFILSVIVLISLAVVPVHADTASDRAFTTRIVEIFGDCQKVKPGMTRAKLVKLSLFDEDRGPLFDPNDKSFKQHTTFQYRAFSLIKIDIDFSPSDSKEARPTDIIAKVSMPFLDARPRR